MCDVTIIWHSSHLVQTGFMQQKVSQRLYIDQPMSEGAFIELSREQANYLLNVLRLPEGAAVAVFNGVEGEWRGVVHKTGKRAAQLELEALIQPQTIATDLHYLFAPLKRARLDYMVQKAVELGVSRLTPVITQHTNVERVNLERMKANAIEAAEQCEILTLPEIDEPVKLEPLLTRWEPERRIVFCDEGIDFNNESGAGEQKGPLAALEQLKGQKIAVLIGPEGGFSSSERDLLLSQSFVKAISLGPRIMRADTAAVAALSLVNAVIGDWR